MAFVYQFIDMFCTYMYLKDLSVCLSVRVGDTKNTHAQSATGKPCKLPGHQQNYSANQSSSFSPRIIYLIETIL